MDSPTARTDRNLLEREAELGALDQALASAIEGRGSVVAIEGPPGIGKSSLVRACLELAAAREMYTISVRATELERSYPYGIVRQTADSVTLDKSDAERAALFTGAAKLALPLLDPGSAEELDSPELMYQRLHGLYWAIANLARDRPLLICIDDAQWADEASMAAERFLSLRIADLPMVLALAVRTSEVGPLAVPLAEILADPATVAIRPGPLSIEGAEQRIMALLGSSEAAFAAACHHATGGNPFLLEQLLSEVRAEGIEPTAASAERVASLGPDTVRASVLLRLERLPSAGGPVARALAVLGEHGVALRDVATLAGVPEDAAAEALAELERSGLVTGAPHLRFSHPILRAAIEDDMPVVERSRAHEQAARMLADRDADPVAVAAHLLVCDPGQGDWARAALRSAARRAEALGDPSAAVRYLERAVTERPDDGELGEVLFELGLAAAHAGNPDAADHLERAAAAGGPTRLRALHWVAVLHLVAGRAVKAADVLESALADVPEESDAAKPLIETLIAVGLGSASVRQRLDDLFEHLVAPPGTPETDFERFTLITLAFLAVVENTDAVRATELVHRALSIEEHGYYESVMRASVGRPMPGFVLALVDRLDESEAILDRLVRAGREYGDRSAVGVFLAERSWIRMRTGAVEGAEADAAEALRVAREATRARGHAPVAASSAVLAGLERERPLAELEAVLTGLPPAGDADTVVQDDLALARSALLLASGDAQGAADAALALDREYSWGCGCPSLLAWRSAAALALSQLGEDERALELAREELRLAELLGTPRAVGIAQRAVALVGPADERQSMLETAMATLEGSAARLELARVTCELGAELRRHGERSAARDILRRAHALAAECGAIRLANRARDELGRSGARLIREPASGVDALTPSEVRVAELAAEGLTNREVAQALFVSEKTVETHLGRVYRKLDIKSRHALPGALTERQATGEPVG
ncbi:MAG TPA: AAA family ATPase [Thermoleophilaceae bacterium]|nr:AAA family ATPase [Thermoleophilaceae bacterium]